LIYEVEVAKNPDNETTYFIGMVSLASSYEKNHKLFQAVMESFTYVPRNMRGKRPE
jgi:hypothetical protein